MSNDKYTYVVVTDFGLQQITYQDHHTLLPLNFNFNKCLVMINTLLSLITDFNRHRIRISAHENKVVNDIRLQQIFSMINTDCSL